MGNSFGFLRTEGGFQFTVLDSCKAEGIDLNRTCSLVFDANGSLIAIGNTTRGTMRPEPGIAGIGVGLIQHIHRLETNSSRSGLPS